MIISNAKKAGYSLQEQNEFRVNELMKLVDMEIGSMSQSRSGTSSVQRANQKQIDMLFA